MPTTRQKRDQRERRYADAKKRAEEHQSGGFTRTAIRLPEGMKTFGIKKAGVIRVDILPYEVPEGANNPYSDPGFLHYERTYYCHNDVGPNQDKYLCLARTYKEKCPICEQRLILGEDEDADTALLKKMQWKERQLFNVVLLDDDGDRPDNAEVLLWDMSFHLFGKLLDVKIKNADPGDNYDAFSHLEDGLSLKLTATEKSMGSNSKPFYEVTDIEFKKRRQQYDDSWLEKVAVLDNLLIKPDYETLRRTFLQLDEGEPEAPAKSRTSKPAAKTETNGKHEDGGKPASRKLAAKTGGKKFATAAEAGLKIGDVVTVVGSVRQWEIDKISKDGTSLKLTDAATGDDYDDGPVGVADVTKVDEDWGDEPQGTSQPADDDEWDDEPKKPAGGKGNKGKQSAASAGFDDDDDADDEDEPWDDEDEPVAKQPAKAGAAKSGGKKPAPADDEDDW